jgi:hypothetical protein
VVLAPAGEVVRTWGENLFKVAHGLRIDRKGFLWVTDNADSFVQKYSADGKLLLTLGQRGVAGGNDSTTNFDGPADVFVLPDGDVLVADGYRNSTARCHARPARRSLRRQPGEPIGQEDREEVAELPIRLRWHGAAFAP